VSELSQIGDRLLVIYDGSCGFCDLSVRWFITRDRDDRLRFVPSDSPKVAALLARHGFNAASATGDSGTILVAQGVETPAERLLIRFDAVLAMLRQLPRPWPAVATILGWIPRPLRDLGYRLVARFRYRIWGRLEFCPIPTAQERNRFL
jgi:predicted DCC family thiol-disulfide oxidoreductase YuxK